MPHAARGASSRTAAERARCDARRWVRCPRASSAFRVVARDILSVRVVARRSRRTILSGETRQSPPGSTERSSMQSHNSQYDNEFHGSPKESIEVRSLASS